MIEQKYRVCERHYHSGDAARSVDLQSCEHKHSIDECYEIIDFLKRSDLAIGETGDFWIEPL